MAKFQYPLFKKLDIFGISPLFTIRGRSTFQTQIGACFTLVCIMIILIYMSVFLHEMIHHKSPNIQSSNYLDEIPPEINLHRNNFTFIFSLQTKDYTNYIDESIYNVNAFQTRLKLNKGIENIPLNIIKRGDKPNISICLKSEYWSFDIKLVNIIFFFFSFQK